MTDHAKLYRTAIRLALCFAAVGGIPVAHAINKGQMGQFRYSPSGNSVSIKPNQAGSTGSLAGVGDLRGNIGTPLPGNPGWYRGGNAPGASTSPGMMTMGHNGDVFFAGDKYPFQAAYKVPKSAIVDSLGILCKNPVICLGLHFAAPSITAWLSKGGVSINPDESDYPDKPFLIKGDKPGTLYRINDTSVPADTGWVGSRATACTKYVEIRGGVEGPDFTFHDPNVVGDQCKFSMRRYGQPYANTGISIDEKTSNGVEDLPASMDDIAPYMDAPEVPGEVIRDLLDRGADITLPSAPTVTGPSSIPGKRETKNNPDGSVTTTTTTNNYRTEGNRISHVNTVTVTQTCTGDGACSPATTTTTEDPKEPEQSDCEKNPDATRCKDIDLDTPDGEIPKAEKSVTYTPESLFGGGSCPANKVMTVHTGQQLTVWNWDSSCGYITGYMRPIVLVLCGFAAFAIVAGGTKP